MTLIDAMRIIKAYLDDEPIASASELREATKTLWKRANVMRKTFTCDGCACEEHCPSAWDGYSTAGDCLEIK